MKKLAGRFAGCSFMAILSIILGLLSGAFAQTEKILNTFNSSNGSSSNAPVIFDKSGNLYGTTDQGGSSNLGVVFQLMNSGGTWSEKVLWSFAGGTGDGCNPLAGLTMDASGNFYGTTSRCGADGSGTVFELTNSGGKWRETVLYSFTGRIRGAYPAASLAIDAEGDLYGTTANGGGGCSEGCGIVFKLSKNHGTWKETVLHKFRDNGADGTNPVSNVIFDRKGNIYGTTPFGGEFGAGTVFRLTKTKAGWGYKLLYTFSGTHGENPYSGLILDISNNLYGTTVYGGASGDGAVFELSYVGKKWTETVLYSFASVGSAPFGNLAFDSKGNLYGPSALGGSSGVGAVFKLTKSGSTWTESVLWSFRRNGIDGEVPYAGVILDSAGNLYGTTGQGGSDGYGIVYEISP